ncbi:MAG TPA: DUF3604 domain-containing protein [Candidatus Acidoferrum sp.]
MKRGTESATALLLALAATLAVAPVSAQEKNPERNAYFGETHVHTSWSLDAWLGGDRITGPGDAYKYFKGEPIKHPLGFDVKIDTPLDWAGVTDHSEYVGVTRLANDPGSPISKLPAAQPLILKNDSVAEATRVFEYCLNNMLSGHVVKSLMSPEVAATVWKKNIELADEANEPGKFTAFCSYEWTAMPNNMNLHRNVFFKDCEKVPEMPFSALDSYHPEDLWNWMDGQRKAGHELLAISHNANLSDGRMYPTDVDSKGRPIDAAYAASRERNEPLIEIKQMKGSSETHPFLSPNDEFASFEIMEFLLGNPQGRIPHIVGSFARQALKDGLTMQDTRGYNPYKFGFGAASDSHNTAVPYRQNNFFGQAAMADGTPQLRLSGRLTAGMDPRVIGTGGLTGVWAEENTRASIFDALQRKETFATSGPHIKVRMFGGWGFAADMMADKDWAKTGYTKGVPMGGDLPPVTATTPTFMVWAVKDPTSGNLDRIQIVKGWSESGQSFEKVFDVAWAGDRKPDKLTGVVGPIGTTVDVENATYTNTIGSVELKTVWKDPEFDPSLHAFYYARVLEIPTPRWTTIQAHQIGVAPPDVVPATLQERAWGSPIWYTPSSDALKTAKRGITVADLKKQGAVALDSEQLKELIVDKTVWFQNTVTGERYEILYARSGKNPSGKPVTPVDPGYVTEQFADNQGQLQLRYVGSRFREPSLVSDIANGSYLGASNPYYINNGKIVTTLVGTPIEITVYKLGKRYLGARSNEFGYVNYEIIPAVEELSPLKGAFDKAFD